MGRYVRFSFQSKEIHCVSKSIIDNRPKTPKWHVIEKSVKNITLQKLLNQLGFVADVFIKEIDLTCCLTINCYNKGVEYNHKITLYPVNKPTKPDRITNFCNVSAECAMIKRFANQSTNLQRNDGYKQECELRR